MFEKNTIDLFGKLYVDNIKKFSSQEVKLMRANLASVDPDIMIQKKFSNIQTNSNRTSNSNASDGKVMDVKIQEKAPESMMMAQIMSHKQKNSSKPEMNEPLKPKKLQELSNPTDTQNKKPKIFDDPKPKLIEDDFLAGKSVAFNFGKPNIKLELLNTDKNANLRISTIKGVKTENARLFDELKFFESKDEDFIDETFPPVLNSLVTDIKDFPLAKEITWRKILDIYQLKKPTLCGDKIGPNDIKQGKLGDCYLLSALSVLAERQNFIKRLFHSKEINPSGLYSVWLCDSGEWKNLLIDSFIPCIKGAPCFSVSKSEDIWVILIEKAFAKLFHNYYNIDGGHQSEALNALTGAPTKYFKERDDMKLEDQMWSFIINSLNKKFILTGATKAEKVMEQSVGIVTNHAYSILKAKEITLKNGTTERLIMMRNPWGNHEWKGDWSDESPQMTLEIKKILQYNPQPEDGTFWISIIDFSIHFDTICSCKVFDDYQFAYLKLGEKKSKRIFLANMKIEKSGKAYITAQQRLKKHYPETKGYEYSYIRMIICQVDSSGRITRFIKGKYECTQSLIIKSEFEKGNYIVFIEVDWIQNYSNIINLTGYSSSAIEITERECDDQKTFNTYVDWVKSFLKSQSKEIVNKPYLYEDGRISKVSKFKGDKGGVVGVLFNNEESNYVLHIRTRLKKLDNMVWLAPKNVKNNTVNLKIPPNSNEIIIIKSQISKDSSSSYSYEYSESSKLMRIYTEAELTQECKTKGKKSDSANGKISVYSLTYCGGYAQLHVNNSEKVLHQTIHFEIENISVNGKSDLTEYSFKIAPGKSHLIDLSLIDIFEASKLSCSYNSKFVNE